jgi:exodeoxyribonuclease-3
MRLTTWNVNSVRLRLGLIERFVAEVSPDVLCFQETKVEDGSFPLKAFCDLGYEHAAIAGQKGYHGVAVLSRRPLADPARVNWCAKGDARHIQVTLPGGVELHNFYVPAGGDEPDPVVNEKFAHKLRFLDEMADFFAQYRNPRAILVGDLNIAPLECDVWSHKKLLRVVSHTPIEVEKLAAVQASLDWCDVMRLLTPPPEPLFTWWSYRARDWRAANRGRRLDHVWVTPALAGAARAMDVLEEARGWERPSDHAPVTVDFSDDLLR